MKFEEVREEYYVNTEKTSELVRQLAFAGIAIVWIFFLGEKPDLKSQGHVVAPLLTLALCLLFDICQYLYASIAWERKYHEGVNKKLNLSDNLSVKNRINMPTTIFFYLKITFLVLSYILLIAMLIYVIS